MDAMSCQQTPFDDWVTEAPFRHLGVFALVVIAIIALALSGCTPETAYRCDKYGPKVDVRYDHYSDGHIEKSTTISRVCVHSTLVTIW
jgi:hypothetical protein